MVDVPQNNDLTGEIYSEEWNSIIDSNIIMGSFDEDHHRSNEFGSDFFAPPSLDRTAFESPEQNYPPYLYDNSINMYSDGYRDVNFGAMAGAYGTQGYPDYSSQMYNYNQGMMSYTNNPVNIKVPLAPIRPSSSDTRRPPAPLLLPFHHKNDNRIIPQTFANHTGIMPHYSIEEIQESKNLFLKKHSELDFDNITVVELKGFLREFSLASGGRKDDLISRIRQIHDYLVNEGSGIMAGENPFALYGGGGYSETY